MTSSKTRRTTALFCWVDIGILSETASAAIRSGQYPFASLGVLQIVTHAAGRSATGADVPLSRCHMLRAPTWHVSDRDHYTLIRRPPSGLRHEAGRPQRRS